MRQLFIASLFLFIALPNTAHAFKWDKCKKVYQSWGPKQIQGKDLPEIVLNLTSQFTSEATMQSTTSTTSFVSSTGDCKAFAKAEEERFTYIAGTFTELKMESAEGQGEHVTSLAALYGCSPQARPQFIEMLKKNHSQIFSDDSAAGSAAVTERITGQLLNTKILRQSCNLETI